MDYPYNKGERRNLRQGHHRALNPWGMLFAELTEQQLRSVLRERFGDGPVPAALGDLLSGAEAPREGETVEGLLERLPGDVLRRLHQELDPPSASDA